MFAFDRIVRRLVSGGLCLAAAVSCHPEPKSTFLEEPGGSDRPLPPASGTPIGFLLDDSARLALRAEQIDRLHEIDRRLAIRNDQLDTELRALDRPPEPAAGEGGGPPGGGGMGGPGGGGMGGMGGGMGGPPGGGMGGGGMGGPPGGGMGGGGRGGGGGGRRGGPPPGGKAGPPPARGDAAARQKLMDERAANTRDALARALDVLDPDQRVVAGQILDEHGATAQPSLDGPGPRPPMGRGPRPPMRHGPPPSGREPPPPDGDDANDEPTPVERPAP